MNSELGKRQRADLNSELGKNSTSPPCAFLPTEVTLHRERNQARRDINGPPEAFPSRLIQTIFPGLLKHLVSATP